MKYSWKFLNFTNDFSNSSTATSMSCVYFSVLYTTMPHDKVLFEIIYFCFKGGDKQVIMIGKYGARWIGNERQRSVTFSQFLLKKAMKYCRTAFFN